MKQRIEVTKSQNPYWFDVVITEAGKQDVRLTGHHDIQFRFLDFYLPEDEAHPVYTTDLTLAQNARMLEPEQVSEIARENLNKILRLACPYHSLEVA